MKMLNNQNVKNGNCPNCNNKLTVVHRNKAMCKDMFQYHSTLYSCKHCGAGAEERYETLTDREENIESGMYRQAKSKTKTENGKTK